MLDIMNELAKPTPEASEPEPPSLAAAAALIGDPVRAAILLHLTDGSRRPASELALLAGASPQAVSAHLARLVDGGLLTVENQGRHRFFSIASGEVAEMSEYCPAQINAFWTYGCVCGQSSLSQSPKSPVPS